MQNFLSSCDLLLIFFRGGFFFFAGRDVGREDMDSVGRIHEHEDRIRN